MIYLSRRETGSEDKVRQNVRDAYRNEFDFRTGNNELRCTRAIDDLRSTKKKVIEKYDNESGKLSLFLATRISQKI